MIRKNSTYRTLYILLACTAVLVVSLACQMTQASVGEAPELEPPQPEPGDPPARSDTGDTWTSEADGKVEDGVFIRTSECPLTIELPEGFVPKPTDQLQGGALVDGAPPAGLPSFQIYVAKINPGTDVDELLKGAAENTKKGIGAVAKPGTEVVMLKNEPTDMYELSDAKAYAAEFEWEHPAVALVSLYHYIVKGDYVITIGGHTMGNTDPLLGTFETLDLEP